MNFEELQRAIADTQTLAKSLSAAPTGAADENKTIAAAAADGAAAGGADGAGATGAGAGASGEDEDEDEDGAGAGNGQVGDGTPTPLTKSFRLQLEDGTFLEAEDGSEMVKALSTQLEAESAARAQDNEMYMKSFGSVLELVTTVTQGVQAATQELKAARADIAALKGENETLQKSLSELGNQGRGRMSVTGAVVTGQQQRQPLEHTPQEILAKATSALSAGRITGTEATKVMTAVNMNVIPQKEILDRIFGN